MASLQIGVILIWEWHVGYNFHLLLVFCEKGMVNGFGWRSKGGSGDKFQGWVANKLSGQPQERLLEVVVGLGGDIVVLKVLLSVEGNGLGLYFALLDINLVSGEDYRNVFADTDQVTVPVGDVLVGNTGGNVEHNDTALAIDVVTITEASKLLLSCGIPDIKLNWAQISAETKRVNLNAESCNIFLLKLSSQVALDESGLSSSSITDKDELEGRGRSFSHDC